MKAREITQTLLRIFKSRATVATALVVSAVLALAACDMKKKLDDMHDATNKLQADTEGLSNKQSELYDALRQGNALQARRDGLKAILRAQDAGAKISEAAKYFSAFEFQIWSGQGYDTPERRDELEAEGAREFMRDVQEFITPGQTEPHPLVQGDPSNPSQDSQNRQACLNALSVAMHLTNPKQDDLIKRNPALPQMTMYKLIQNALRAKKEIDSGAKRLEAFPLYVNEILIFEPVARLLVQTRFNFFGAMLLGSVSDIRQGDHTRMGLPYWMNIRAGEKRVMDWTMDLDTRGLAELREDTLFMTGAQKVVVFMAEIGMTPKLNSLMKGILQHAQYSPAVEANLARVKSLTPGGTGPQVSELARAQADLATAFEMYRRH